MLCLIIHSGWIYKTERNSQVLNPSLERSLLHFPSHFPVVAYPWQWLVEGCPSLPQARSPSSRKSPAGVARGSLLANLLCLSELLPPLEPVWVSLHCSLSHISFYTWHIPLLPQLVSHAVLHSALGFAYAGFTQLQFNWLQWHYSWG